MPAFLRMRKLITITAFIFLCALGFSQNTGGSTGLLNIPSAEMQKDGTFYLGGNFLPNAITPDPFNYDTGNYFLNITFLPFLEFTYCSTLMKFEGNLNQDRAFGVRLRLLKETKYLPAIVTGGSDLYSSSGGIGSRYFNSVYLAATKHFSCNPIEIGLTAGGGNGGVRNQNYNGFFCGLSISPSNNPHLKFLLVYDSNVFSPGIECTVWEKLHLFYEAYQFRYSTAGVSLKFDLKKNSK